MAILIITLTTLVIFVLIKKINNNIDDTNYINELEFFKIEKNFNLNSFQIDDGKIYLYLKSDKREILRIQDFKSGKIIREYELKNDI